MKQIIGLVGPIASGKGTLIKILEKNGFKSYSTSDRIREELTKRGLEFTRQNLTNVANELRETLGTDILAKRTAELIEKDNPEFAVVDAIRNPAEVNFFKQRFDAKIIGVVANQEKRFELFKLRGANNAGINTWDEFKQHDDAELAQTGGHMQQVAECLKLADTIIENNGTIEELTKKINDDLKAS